MRERDKMQSGAVFLTAADRLLLGNRNERFLDLMRDGHTPEQVIEALSLRPADFRCLRKWAIGTGRLPSDTPDLATINRKRDAARERAEASQQAMMKLRMDVLDRTNRGYGRSATIESLGITYCQYVYARRWLIANGYLTKQVFTPQPAPVAAPKPKAPVIAMPTFGQWPAMSANAFAAPAKQKAAE